MMKTCSVLIGGINSLIISCISYSSRKYVFTHQSLVVHEIPSIHSIRNPAPSPISNLSLPFFLLLSPSLLDAEQSHPLFNFNVWSSNQKIPFHFKILQLQSKIGINCYIYISITIFNIIVIVIIDKYNTHITNNPTTYSDYYSVK